MFIKMLTTRVALASAAVILLATTATQAQMNQRLAEAQAANARALRQFEWKSRNEILKDGELKRAQLAVVRYDAQGKLEHVVTASTPEPDLPSFGLRGMIAKKKKKEFLEKVEKLSALAKAYSNVPPDVMQRFMTSASFTPDGPNLMRITGRNVIHGGDSMVIFVDAVSRKQRRIEIQSMLDDKPVRIVSYFRDLPDGPTYMARSEITYNSGDIAMITENFDHTSIQR